MEKRKVRQGNAPKVMFPSINKGHEGGNRNEKAMPEQTLKKTKSERKQKKKRSSKKDQGVPGCADRPINGGIFGGQSVLLELPKRKV